jgi:hypothetical protein
VGVHGKVSLTANIGQRRSRNHPIPDELIRRALYVYDFVTWRGASMRSSKPITVTLGRQLTSLERVAQAQE